MRRPLGILFSLLICTPPSYAMVTARGLDKDSYTTDFMIGNVVVSVIFPESDGTNDQNRENWSEERKAQALSQIMSGLDWWTKQNPRSPLNFTFVSQTVRTKYEPITRPYYDEALWIPDVMSKLGYNGNRFVSTRDYVNALRQQYKADWGFVIFVVDSLADTDGKFTDGLFAYSYLGGPFTVMTYDNDGYGISNMGVVVAHETGHIFNALDEYAGASGPNDYTHGYFSVINGNHVYSPTANAPDSIMRGGLRWGLDAWARQAVGWRDSDSNNRDDILDQSPITTISQQAQQLGGNMGFSGQATVAILPRQGNGQGAGLTLDTISKVEYRFKSSDWAAASPVDGNFDSAQEDFQIALSAAQLGSLASISSKDIDVRVTTSYLTKSGGNIITTSSTGLLANAHPFPNPFKPNSSLGHTNVTFSNLTSGAKVQIFTVAGELVFKKEAVTGASTLTWNAVDDDGKDVASGVYYFLITDPAGNKKDGKLAVIR